jgi:hypothetical protein
LPVGESIRVDTHAAAGTTITPFYDSLVAKVVVHGDTRARAIARMRGALDAFRIDGITTNLSLQRSIMDDARFASGAFGTRFLERDEGRPRIRSCGAVARRLDDRGVGLRGIRSSRGAHCRGGAALCRRTRAARPLACSSAASNGDRRTRGMNHFAHEGLVRRVIAGGWRGTPMLGELALKGTIEAYNWPQGVLCQLFRATAARQPGVVTRTGLGTFVDPRIDGGRLNERSARDRIKLLEIGGEEFCSIPRSASIARWCAARPPTPRAT